MQTIPLYRYIRPDGGISVSVMKPDVEYTYRYRLIADEGKAITDGTTTATCVDVEIPNGWTEIEAPEEDIGLNDESQYAEAGKILMGVMK